MVTNQKPATPGTKKIAGYWMSIAPRQMVISQAFDPPPCRILLWPGLSPIGTYRYVFRLCKGIYLQSELWFYSTVPLLEVPEMAIGYKITFKKQDNNCPMPYPQFPSGLFPKTFRFYHE